MAENEIRIPDPELDRLLTCGDGTAALLYLLVRRDGAYRPEAAAKILGCTRESLDAAAELLYRLDLLSKPESPLPDDTLPQYTLPELTARMADDTEFRGMLRHAERVFGYQLSGSDANDLLGLRNYYGLSGEVICLLINHCAETNSLKYGSGRRLTMRAVKTEGRFWSENNITTYEEAERHIARESEQRSKQGQIMTVLQIRGRELTKTERGYVEKWVSAGFGPEAVAIAYDRTVTATGRLVWKYMDVILSGWQEKKLFTPEQIEAGDPRRQGAGAKKSAAAAATAAESTEDKLARLARLNKRMENGEKNGNGT